MSMTGNFASAPVLDGDQRVLRPVTTMLGGAVDGAWQLPGRVSVVPGASCPGVMRAPPPLRAATPATSAPPVIQ
jgi:hypothetical protein